MSAVLTEDDLTLTPHPSPLTVFRLNGLQEKARTKEKAIGNGLKRTRDDLVDGHLSFRREAICLKPLCSILNVWSNFPPSEVAGKSQKLQTWHALRCNDRFYQDLSHTSVMLGRATCDRIAIGGGRKFNPSPSLLTLTRHPHSDPHFHVVDEGIGIHTPGYGSFF